MKVILASFLGIFAIILGTNNVLAQRSTPSPATSGEVEATASSTVIEKSEPTPVPRPDITQKTLETVEPLKKLLDEQLLGPVLPLNPLKYAIREAINAGVPPNTIVLLLLLPGVATLIAAARHIIGLRGFGIFLPAALSLVFVALGPLLGIGLFLLIVAISTSARILMRRTGLKLQYLPRMALMLLFVVFGVLSVLFLAPIVNGGIFSNISIFPVLILVLLAEDFSKVQLGKSAKTALMLASETLVLSLASFLFLTLGSIQKFALLNPEVFLILVAAIDVLLGKFIGLRVMEIVRFRRLITS